MKLHYRPEIDGLRTLAVVPVILFHAGIPGFGGGFVGVDIFFVISGYLITLIIDREILAKDFSIAKFYERRVRRILPAMFLVLSVSTMFAWLWLTPSELKDYGQSLVAVNLFASNILFWRETGYFGGVGEFKPLLHTWSLAVEEQFYVIFPLLLLGLSALARRFVIIAVAALVILSFGLAEMQSHLKVDSAFFLAQYRAWELGVGALVALVFRGQLVKSGLLSSIGSIVGLAAILLSIVLLDGDTPFPGIYALPCVLGAALIILCAHPGNPVGRLLSTSPFVWIGLLSYSAYLWHQPLFALVRIRYVNEVPMLGMLALSLCSLGAAYLSWRFVEQPFRTPYRVSKKPLMLGAGLFAAALVAIGAGMALTNGAPWRLKPEAARLASYAAKKNPRTEECLGNARGFYTTPENACIYNTGMPPRVALWGDSHADALASGLADALKSTGSGVRALTNAGCRPAIGLGSERCDKVNADILRYLIAATDIDVVVITCRYTIAIEGKRFDNQEGGVEFGGDAYALPTHRDRRFINDPSRVPMVGESLRAPIKKLLDAGKHVVLVYPVPEVGWNVPKHLARVAMFSDTAPSTLSTSYAVFEKRTAVIHSELEKLGQNPSLINVRPETVFCNTQEAGRCMAAISGAPLYYDEHHLGSVGAAMLSQEIVQSVVARGWIPSDIR